MRNFIKKIIFRNKRNGISIGHEVRKYSDVILHEVKLADSILLHCHPSPDPDSVGSALAMKFVLESMGKKVTVIAGDSEIPKGFMHFPGAEDIVKKNIFEVDIKAFDLFISVDAASLEQISKKGKVTVSESIKVINIDHHATNTRFGAINLVETSYPACAQVLYELFLEWRVKMTREIAENLFMGIYTDTVEFRTPLTTPKTLLIASKLMENISGVEALLSRMENSETKEHVKYVGLMLNSTEAYFDNKIAISSIDLETLNRHAITRNDISGHHISALMRSVADWEVLIAMTEVEPNKIKVSTRSKDANKYDVSKLAEALGGGGHKAAAGILMLMSLEEAKKMLISKAKELFKL